jgi:vacuolar-type H+-ATPase subunit I/STV1
MNTADQVRFVDLTDEALKDAVGALHERVKRLMEAKKEDEEIAALEAQLKELKSVKYGEEIREVSRNLTAARRAASLRGIVFKMPKIEA